MPPEFDNLLIDSQGVNDLAYHGTEERHVDKILNDGFIVSDGEDQFLGTGVYFFDNQKSMAIWWAKNHRKYSPWAVIRATIRVGRCFNIHEDSHADALKLLIDALKQEDPDVSDATAINALAELTPVDTVVCNVGRKNGDQFRPKSRFIKGRRAIICVRDPSRITDRKLDCTGD